MRSEALPDNVIEFGEGDKLSTKPDAGQGQQQKATERVNNKQVDEGATLHTAEHVNAKTVRQKAREYALVSARLSAQVRVVLERLGIDGSDTRLAVEAMSQIVTVDPSFWILRHPETGMAAGLNLAELNIPPGRFLSVKPIIAISDKWIPLSKKLGKIAVDLREAATKRTCLLMNTLPLEIRKMIYSHMGCLQPSNTKFDFTSHTSPLHSSICSDALNRVEIKAFDQVQPIFHDQSATPWTMTDHQLVGDLYSEIFRIWLEEQPFVASVSRAHQLVNSDFIGLGFQVSEHIRHLCIKVRVDGLSEKLDMGKLVQDLVSVFDPIRIKKHLKVDLTVGFGEPSAGYSEHSRYDRAKAVTARSIIGSFVTEFQLANRPDLNDITIVFKAFSDWGDDNCVYPDYDNIVRYTRHTKSEWSTMLQKHGDIGFLAMANERKAEVEDEKEDKNDGGTEGGEAGADDSNGVAEDAGADDPEVEEDAWV
jgi:hypothetical protein